MAGDAALWPNDGFYERFKEVLEALPTLQKAADLTGYSPEQIAKWRDRKAKPPFWPVTILARETGRSLDWLVTGHSPKEVDTSPGRIAEPMRDLDQGHQPDELENLAFVAQLDVIASAGAGYENIRPYEIGALPFPKTWLQRLGLAEHHVRFIDCRGDSMEPTIMDGAICLVDIRFQQTRGDGIYVLIDGPNVRIKRIAVGWEGALRLISDNERYEAEQLAAPDAEALRIAGKVVWAGGEI